MKHLFILILTCLSCYGQALLQNAVIQNGSLAKPTEAAASPPAFVGVFYYQTNETSFLVQAASNNVTGSSPCMFLWSVYEGALQITAASRNGKSFTLLTNATGTTTVSLWVLPNCDTGAYDISVTKGGGTATIGVAWYSGVNTTTPLDDQIVASGSGTSYSSGQVTPASNELPICITGNASYTPMTLGQTQDWNSGTAVGAGTYGQRSTGGSPVTFTATGEGSRTWQMIAMSLKP